MDKKKADQILEVLSPIYGGMECALVYEDPFELLVSTILAAQCTDVRVNIVTKVLFAEANTPRQIIDLGTEKLYEIIKPCGLAATKAPNIIATCEILIEKYDGIVPKTRDELTALPGVGRKTANIILAVGYGLPAIAVDTHVQRVSNRIGLADSPNNVLKTEYSLMRWIPETMWNASHHWLVWHGRKICHARSPECGKCPINGLCEWPDKI